MRRLVVATVLAATLVAITGTSRAEPTDLVARPIVLGAGELDLRVSWEMNLLRRRLAQPLSIAPDAWYGISDRVTVGVIHSSQSVDRIDSVSTFCVRELFGQCTRVYQGSGIDALWSWRAGALAVAPRARALLRGVDPVKPAVTLGALVRWTRGRFAISGDPYVRVGLANVDHGNRAALFLPLWFAFQPTCRWLVGMHTGWDSELAVIRDGWHIPFGLLTRVRVDRIELGVEVGFRTLLGPQNNYSESAAIVTLGYRGPT